ARRPSLSGRVAEDRCKRPVAGDVLTPDGEHVTPAQQRPPGDLVDDAVVDRVVCVVDADGAVLVDVTGNDLVDVDEQRVDHAKGGSARDVGDVAGCTPLGCALRVSLLNRTELRGIDVVEQAACAVGKLGVRGGVRGPGETCREQVRVAVHRPI